jgi:broad specificity phosphatase PhoE
VVKSEKRESRLWFVRHGESTWNASGLVQGQADGPVLTAKGRREAARVTEQLGDLDVTAIYSSDLERARETAAIVADALRVPLYFDPRLRERCFGDAQGQPLTALRPAHSGVDGARVVDVEARPPAGESLREVYERVRDFIDAMEAPASEGHLLVVAHGGVVRVAEAYCDGVAVEDMCWGVVANASVWGLRRHQATESVMP